MATIFLQLHPELAVMILTLRSIYFACIWFVQSSLIIPSYQTGSRFQHHLFSLLKNHRETSKELSQIHAHIIINDFVDKRKKKPSFLSNYYLYT